MIIKLGENLSFSQADIYSADAILSDPELAHKLADDSEMLAEFRKTAAELKRIAPKANDFLYFTAVMMHAAEASLLDDNGVPRKDASGKIITAHWDKKGDSWKWVCSDSNTRPLANANRDIFPEEELLKAYKKWVGKPLCLDHKSSSVDMIRGLIVDTYYDRPRKRVVALCALDKANYPDLARKVSTGVSNCVSMGTAVAIAICTDCGRPARVEADFCEHMIRKSCYGEINIGLNPIELSIVVNGADPNAKIRHIVAAADSMAKYMELKKAAHKMVNPSLIDEIISKLEKLKSDAEAVIDIEKAEGESIDFSAQDGATDQPKTATASLQLSSIEERLEKIQSEISKISQLNKESLMSNNVKTTNAYFQGAGGENEPTPGKPRYTKEEADKIRNTEDRHLNGESPFPNVGSPTTLYPGDEQKKKDLLRIAAEKREQALKGAKEAAVKSGYLQGGGGANEPTPGKVKYPKEEADKTRNTEDRQQTGESPFPGVGKTDGLYDGDLETKKKWLRATLNAKLFKQADLGQSYWVVLANDEPVFKATLNEVAKANNSTVEASFDGFMTEKFGSNLMKKIRSEGFDKAAEAMKLAQLPAPTPPAPALSGNVNVSGDSMAPLNPPMDTGKSGSPKDVIPELISQCQNHLSDLSKMFEALNNEAPNELGDLGDLAGEKMASAKKWVSTHKALHKVLTGTLKRHCSDLTATIDDLKMANSFVSDASIMKKANDNKDRSEAINSMIESSIKDAKSIVAKSWQLTGSAVKFGKSTEAVKTRLASLKKDAQVSLPGISENVDPSFQHGLDISEHRSTKRVNPETGKAETMKHDKWYADGTNMYWDGAKYVSVAAPKHDAPKAPAAPVSNVPSDAAYSGGDHNVGLQDSATRMKELNSVQLKDHQPDAQHKGVADVDTVNKTKIPGQPSDLSVSQEKAWHPREEDPKKPGNQADDGMADDKPVTVTKGDMKADMTPEAAKDMMKADASTDTKEARAQRRAKLAEKAMQVNPLLQQAHPQSMTPKLDTKPSGDLARVENLVEKQKAIMDVATAPVKVRKAAEEINQLVTTGKLNPDTDFPAFIAEGLDPEAIKYWRSFYGQAKDGGSQFAAEMIKEHANKKAQEDMANYKVKFARAYSMANEMADHGLIGKDAASVNTQVDEIMTWNDQSFNNIKQVLNTKPVRKQASVMPQVGLLHRDEVYVQPENTSGSDLKVQLEQAFNAPRRGR